MWDLPRPGLEPMSPALAGRFSTTAPPGKPPTQIWIQHTVPPLPSSWPWVVYLSMETMLCIGVFNLAVVESPGCFPKHPCLGPRPDELSQTLWGETQTRIVLECSLVILMLQTNGTVIITLVPESNCLGSNDRYALSWYLTLANLLNLCDPQCSHL